jgi:hypothetical protein
VRDPSAEKVGAEQAGNAPDMREQRNRYRAVEAVSIMHETAQCTTSAEAEEAGQQEGEAARNCLPSVNPVLADAPQHCISVASGWSNGLT